MRMALFRRGSDQPLVSDDLEDVKDVLTRLRPQGQWVARQLLAEEGATIEVLFISTIDARSFPKLDGKNGLYGWTVDTASELYKDLAAVGFVGHARIPAKTQSAFPSVVLTGRRSTADKN